MLLKRELGFLIIAERQAPVKRGCPVGGPSSSVAFIHFIQSSPNQKAAGPGASASLSRCRSHDSGTQLIEEALLFESCTICSVWDTRLRSHVLIDPIVAI